jgi:hypothetical protein
LLRAVEEKDADEDLPGAGVRGDGIAGPGGGMRLSSNCKRSVSRSVILEEVCILGLVESLELRLRMRSYGA